MPTSRSLAQLDRWLDGRLSEEDSIALRRAVLEQPAMRDLRDGMIAAREILPRALPALFAAAPPRALTERLLKIVQHHERTIVPNLRARWAQGALALGVLALAAAIILLPSFCTWRNAGRSSTATCRASTCWTAIAAPWWTARPAAPDPVQAVAMTVMPGPQLVSAVPLAKAAEGDGSPTSRSSGAAISAASIPRRC